MFKSKISVFLLSVIFSNFGFAEEASIEKETKVENQQSGDKESVASPFAVDPSRLDLASVGALILDSETQQVLYERNPDMVKPIASITKLMTAMVVLDAKQPLDEMLPIAIHETSELKNVFSRVRLQSQLTRKNIVLLMLMASENRAAATLAHHYPEGYDAFIKAMNAKAKALDMNNTRFVEPTGLSNENVSTARELAKLVNASASYEMISELSTTAMQDTRFKKPNYSLAFYNTNRLVRKNEWEILVSKTGFTNPAGQCLVMQAIIQERPVTLVLLDSFGKLSHVGDAARVKRWLETGKGGAVPASAKAYAKRKIQQLAPENS